LNLYKNQTNLFYLSKPNVSAKKVESRDEEPAESETRRAIQETEDFAARLIDERARLGADEAELTPRTLHLNNPLITLLVAR